MPHLPEKTRRHVDFGTDTNKGPSAGGKSPARFAFRAHPAGEVDTLERHWRQKMRSPTSNWNGHCPIKARDWRRIGRTLGLSSRPLEIVKHITAEQGDREIATALGLTVHTVHTHVERLYTKLGVHSRAGVVARIFAAHLARNLRSAPRRPVGYTADLRICRQVLAWGFHRLTCLLNGWDDRWTGPR